MPHAQLWSCRDCGLRQALVFERGAQGPGASRSTILPCAACEAIHHVALPDDTDRESVRIAAVPGATGEACPRCGTPMWDVRSGAFALAVCDDGHQGPGTGSG